MLPNIIKRVKNELKTNLSSQNVIQQKQQKRFINHNTVKRSENRRLKSYINQQPKAKSIATL